MTKDKAFCKENSNILALCHLHITVSRKIHFLDMTGE